MRRDQPLLRTQLLTWLLVPLTLLLIADALVSYWITLDFSRRAYDRTLVEIAHEVALHLRAADGRLVLDMPEAARRILLSDPSDKIHFGITAEDGTRIAGSPLPAPRVPINRGPRDEVIYDGEIDAEAVRLVEYRTDADPQSGRPAAVVRVAETQVKRRALAREMLLSVIVPQVVLILTAGFLVWVGVARGLAPLLRLQKSVASRSSHDLSPVAIAEVPGEVRPLLESINGLLERLGRAMTLQSRFVADAAHQLKTPVAGLQAQIELALRQDDAMRARESLVVFQSGLERLARLVSQLLSLARNEPDAATAVRLERVDLNALALQTASAWVPEALDKNIDLGFEGASMEIPVDGDAERLRELFDNLLDNAIRYTPPGGRVTVQVRGAPQPRVSVDDDGPSIPEHERQRVFERFHRLLGTGSDGSGLGLSIAREIARIHSAEITLEDDLDGKGNRFTVVFPASRPRGPAM